MGTDGLFPQELTEEAEGNGMRVRAPDSISIKAALVGETPRDAILARRASALRSGVCNVLRYKLQNPIHCIVGAQP
jgi:hypothetical protein